MTGTIKVQHFNYSRAAHPCRFGAALIVIVAAGIGTLITGIWFWFLKQD
jgi:hypothetical protein